MKPDPKQPGLRPPAPGPAEEASGNGATDPFANMPDTGRHLIQSLPPGPKGDDMAKWIASVENRLGGGSGGGGGGKRDSDPVPKYARHTKTVIDYVKWIGTVILFLVGLGWIGREYVSSFQTDDEATAAQESINTSIADVGERVGENEESIDSLQRSGAQILLEQQNANDRLDQILELQQAGSSRAERRQAAEKVERIERNIRERRRMQRDPRALERLADEIADDPLGGLGALE